MEEMMPGLYRSIMDSIMDSERNPLRHLAAIRRFQMRIVHRGSGDGP
jgi:hypothetical protein